MLAIVPGAKQRAHRGLHEDGRGSSTYDDGDVFWERAVAELHGVHSGPGNATPAAVAVHGHLVWNARDRVLGDDHRMPFRDLAATPYPHGVVTLDGCWLIDRTPSPIAGAAGCQ